MILLTEWQDTDGATCRAYRNGTEIIYTRSHENGSPEQEVDVSELVFETLDTSALDLIYNNMYRKGES